MASGGDLSHSPTLTWRYARRFVATFSTDTGLCLLVVGISSPLPLQVQASKASTDKLAAALVARMTSDEPRLGVPGAPNIALRGFQRVTLRPGKEKPVRFHLHARDLSLVSPEGIRRIVGCGLPGDGLATTRGVLSLPAPERLPL